MLLERHKLPVDSEDQGSKLACSLGFHRPSSPPRGWALRRRADCRAEAGKGLPEPAPCSLGRAVRTCPRDTAGENGFQMATCGTI